MKTVQTLAMAAGLASVASAHMEMLFPAPFKSKANPNAGQDVDYSNVDPLKPGNFPCKGYHSLFGTPAGASTADFTAGQSYEMTIAGGANHGGGSCQASLSFDKGATWKVIHSYIGGCPVSGESKLPFTVPADTPAGEAIFAWTWFNQIGNREMYMNCAAVNIVGGGAGKRQASTPFSSRPDMFVANIDGCKVPDNMDVDFPNPGPDVTMSDKAVKAAPVGECGAAAAPAPGGNVNPVQSSEAPVQPTEAPVQPSSEMPPVQPTMAVPTASDAGDVFITVPGGAASSQAPVMPPVASSEAPVVPPVASSQAPAMPPVPTSEASAAPTQSVSPSSPAPVSSKTDECNISSVTRPGTPSTMVTVPAPPKPTGPSTPVAPVPTPGMPTGGAGGFAAGTPCTAEGQWNCVSGSQFQRCAAGQWSILQPMAAGVTCVPGQSDNLSYAKRAPRALWWV